MPTSILPDPPASAGKCLNCGAQAKRFKFSPLSDFAKYCSPKCCAEFRRRRPPPEASNCQRCGRQLAEQKGRGPRRKYCSEKCKHGYQSRRSARRCIACGKAFIGSSNAQLCPGGCRVRIPREKRSRRLRDVYVEDVALGVLFRRDGGICRICGRPIDASLSHPDPGSASVDHVIPVSKGGEHSYGNTQLAHLVCNLSKGDRCDAALSPSPQV